VAVGEAIDFRCSDIGKFRFVGSHTRTCRAGRLEGEVTVVGGRTPRLQMPKCVGLNQAFEYSPLQPPTILFRHEKGPIRCRGLLLPAPALPSQSNTGTLLVMPGTTVHMECLFQKKFGTPVWSHPTNSSKTYPQNWAQVTEGPSSKLTCCRRPGPDAGLDPGVPAERVLRQGGRLRALHMQHA
jgi:hypothetical protein